MRQIRYGYFRIYYFQAEPDRVPDLEKKLNLDASLLRVIMSKYKPKNQTKKISQIFSDVAIAANADEKKAPVVQVASQVEELQTVSKPKIVEPTGPRVTEAVELKDIDKKLDEILEGKID